MQESGAALTHSTRTADTVAVSVVPHHCEAQCP